MLAVVPTFVSSIVRLVCVTLRFEVLTEPGFIPPSPPGTGIYCFWHQCIIPCTWYFRRYRCYIIISRSFDGELITRTIAKFNYSVVRGSSSRGGAQALLALKGVVDAGMPVIFTADGPRGPIYKTKMGPVKLAQMTGQPVGSFHLLPEHAWQLKSWDRFLIPRPFSRVIVSWGAPVFVARDSSEIELEIKRQELEAAMERARQQAEHHLRPQPQTALGDN